MNVKKKQKLKKLVRQSTAIILSIGLWSWPVFRAPQAYGQEAWNTINAALDFTKNSMIQAMQGSMQAQQAAAMANSLRPKLTPAQYFPHCAIPWAKTDKPFNMCESPNPNELMLMDSLTSMSAQYEAFYERSMSEAQNTPYPVGIQCLENGRKSVEAQMKDKLNQLEVSKGQLMKLSQAFRDQHKEMLEQMRKVNSLLEGNAEAADEKSRDWKVIFGDSSCSEVLSDSLLTSPSTGLRSIMGAMNSAQGGKSLRELAINTQKDMPVLQQHLQKEIARIRGDISKIGLADWMQQDFSKGAMGQVIYQGGLTRFGGMNEVLSLKQRDFAIKMKRIQEQLAPLEAKYGFSLPPLDTNFQQNIARFKQGAKDFFKKKYVNDCVTLKADGVGLDMNQLLSSLEVQSSRGGPGSRVDDYRNAVKRLLDRTDLTIEDKLARLREIDQQYGGSQIVARIRDVNQRQAKVNVYDLLRDQIARCNAKFTQDETFNPDSPNRTSASREIDQAMGYIDEAIALNQSFANEISNAIYDKITNCGGASDERAGQCGADKMSTSSPDFCMATASRCASNINSCYGKAYALVKQNETKLQQYANTYNQHMGALVASQERILKNIQAQVLRDAAFFKQYFPGSNFTFPKDLFVPVPQMEMSQFGVRLLGGGQNLEELGRNLDEQIEKLKMAMADQGKKMDKTIADYTKEQKKAMAENLRFWQGMKERCKNVAQDTRKNMGEAAQKSAMAYQEQMQQAQEFCHKYEGLATSENPAAGCDGDFSPSSLYTDAQKVVAFIDQTVIEDINAYRSVCAQANSDSGEDEEEVEAPSVLHLCKLRHNNWNAVLKELREDFIEKMAGAYDSKGLEDYILGKGDSLAGVEAEGKLPQGLRKQLDSLRALHIIKEKDSDVKTDDQFNKEILELAGAPGKSVEDKVKAELSKVKDNSCIKGYTEKQFLQTPTILKENIKTCSNEEDKKKLVDLVASLPKSDYDPDIEKRLKSLVQARSKEKDKRSPTSEKEDDSYGDRDRPNLCDAMNAEIALISAKECADKKFTQDCVDKKKSELAKSPPSDSQIASIDTTVAYLSKVRFNPVAVGWKQIGETRAASCMKGANSGPFAKVFNGGPMDPRAFDAMTLGRGK